MPDIFDKVHGARFPEVVMNAGPLPSLGGGLPAPLHDTPDGKINYNSTLFGDMQPYAYGEPGYLSSQNGYLNIPHRIQKIIPVVHLPEPNGDGLFRLSHGVDDGDIAFCMRLNRTSMFCTGTKLGSRHNFLGTNIDPFINLPTLNYILAGIQLTTIDDPATPYWLDLLHALDPKHFPDRTSGRRDYANNNKLSIRDLVYIVQNCIRPFGIMRGSEKQGGQDEESMGPAHWPVPFVGTFVVDGREDHVVNMWHSIDVDSGEDLVLRFKPMPVHRYNLNHYYKNPVYKTFSPMPDNHSVVWQLVPDKFSMDLDEYMYEYVSEDANAPNMPHEWLYYPMLKRGMGMLNLPVDEMSWQELGYWHIGRTQIRMHKYMVDGGKYYHNDMVNALRSQYMLLTFQPVFEQIEHYLTEANYNNFAQFHVDYDQHRTTLNTKIVAVTTKQKARALQIEKMLGIQDNDDDIDLGEGRDYTKGKNRSWEWVDVGDAVAGNVQADPVQDTLSTVATDMDVESRNPGILKKSMPSKRKKLIPGSVIHTDGSTEIHNVQQL